MVLSCSLQETRNHFPSILNKNLSPYAQRPDEKGTFHYHHCHHNIIVCTQTVVLKTSSMCSAYSYVTNVFSFSHARSSYGSTCGSRYSYKNNNIKREGIWGSGEYKNKTFCKIELELLAQNACMKRNFRSVSQSATSHLENEDKANCICICRNTLLVSVV